MSLKNNVTILDCTLRDGGYYNDWDFDINQAKRLISALNNAGVNIVEIGYKSANKDKYYGLFKYCNENYLDFLYEFTGSEYAFMIDAKEFLTSRGIDYKKLDEIIKNAADSPFSWCRIASYFNTLNQCPELISYFSDKGYKVGFNLMGGSLLSEDQFKEALQLIDKTSAEVFYAADSFGSMYPEDVRKLIRLLKNNFSRKTGIHTHDNQGLAYANTLAAIEEGVDFVDATVTGMGRGAGNLATEQFLLGYGHITSTDLNSNALLGIIQDYIQPLKEKHQWGYSYIYMLSGLQNIHPTYCQTLSEGNKLSVSQLSSIIEKIPDKNRSAYNAPVLKVVMGSTLGKEISGKGKKIASFVLPDWKDSTVLIVAPGPSALKHKDSITTFIHNNNVKLIECNYSGILDGFDQRVIVLLNQMRLTSYLRQHTSFNATLVTGEKAVDDEIFNDNIFHQDYQIGEANIKDNVLYLPDYEAGQFAILLAIAAGARKVFLAGFDGYNDEQKNSFMDRFFNALSSEASFSNISVISLTPSNYKNIAVQSIYAV
jgi:4-hydroxy 2-oxovalerate aldolase